MEFDPELIVTSPAERLIRRGQVSLTSEYLREPFPEVEPGATVSIISENGEFLGKGYCNTNSKIPLRLMSYENEKIDFDFILRRCLTAAEYRHKFYSPTGSYRLIHSEADGLPGLIIDKFNAHYCVQISTFGIERLKPWITEILVRCFNAESLFFLCDSLGRKKEGLECYKQIAHGKPVLPLCAEIDGVEYYFDPLSGHKTGFFLDQRENRRLSALISPGKRVLDLFCYCGAFSIASSLAGADHVDAVDIFQEGIDWGKRSASHHKLESRITFHRQEATQFMKSNTGQKWDVVFLDPPSLVRGYRRAKRNLSNYRKINRLALELVNPGGVFVTSICSYHVTPDDFHRILGEVFHDSKRNGYIFRQCGASFDHPVFPGRSETDYLKTFFIQIKD